MLLSKPTRTYDDQTFKLMALPDHARKIVILNMGAVQMYLISRCSSKMKNLLKKSISQIQFTLQIEIDESIFFIIEANGVDLGSFEVRSLEPGMDEIAFSSGNFDNLITSWNDVFHGASSVYRRLLDRFSCQMRLCRLPSKGLDVQRLVGWTSTLEPKLTDIGITIPGNVNERRYSYFMNILEKFYNINIHLFSKQYFRNIDLGTKGKRVIIYSAEWVTLDDLFKFDSVVLRLFNVRLTDGEINEFLKAYVQNETGKNLEHMSLSVNRQLDINTVLDGLVWSRVEEEDVRIFGIYGTLSGFTNRGGIRIVMKNREICYLVIRQGEIRIFNWKDEVFTPFQLLKLPSLALEEVIKSMSLMEAFNLSLSHPTLRYFVKYFFKKQKFKLQVQITDYIEFRLESSNGYSVYFEAREYPEVLEDLDGWTKFGKASRTPFYYSDPKSIRTFWRDIVEGATEFYFLISDLFNIYFEKFEVFKEHLNADYGSVVEWINRINRPIEDVYFDKGDVDDTFYSQIIQSENFQTCYMNQKTSENFKMPEFLFTDAHVNWEIYHAHWITPENLTEIGSACLVLKNLELTDQEVNILLINLMTGKFQNLELMSLEVNGRAVSIEVLMDGIADLENDEENWDVRVFDRYGFNITVDGTTDVRMTTGETCSFVFSLIEDEETMKSRVTAIIWK